MTAERRAREAGVKLVTKSGEDIQTAFEAAARKSPEEYAFMREGLMDAFEDRLIKRARGGATANTMMELGGDDLMKMRLMFPDDASFDALVQYLTQEGNMAATSKGMLSAMGKPITGENPLSVGYITTGRAIRNDLLTSLLEDPSLQATAAGHVGRFMQAGVGEAPEILGQIQGAAQDAAGIANVRGRMSGVLTSDFVPPMGPRSLLELEEEEKRGRRQ